MAPPARAPASRAAIGSAEGPAVAMGPVVAAGGALVHAARTNAVATTTPRARERLNIDESSAVLVPRRRSQVILGIMTNDSVVPYARSRNRVNGRPGEGARRHMAYLELTGMRKRFGHVQAVDGGD